MEQFWRHHKEVWTKSGATEMAAFPNGMNVVELITVGRKSGQERSALLTSLPADTGWLVTASNIGADNHPAWWLNLEAADHKAKVRVAGGEIVDVQAVELEGSERQAEWGRLCAAEGSYEAYEQKTDRHIPVIDLRPNG